MKNFATVMAVMIFIIAMGLMVGCGCGTTNDMSTDDMVDQTLPESTTVVPQTTTTDTSIPDVIEGTPDTSPVENGYQYDENGNLVDDNGTIIEDAGNAVGNVIDDAGNAVGNVMEDVGNGIKDMTDPTSSSESATDTNKNTSPSR